MLPTKRRRENKADKKRKGLRDQLWPGSAGWVWTMQDDMVVGFATMSRLMPLVMHLIKHLTKEESWKGDPSMALLDLWCRDFGQGIIAVDDEEECAYASGYSSNRAVRTWREHMYALVNLGFILARPKGNREYGQILLVNPLAVCSRLHEEGRVPDQWWTAFVTRASEIGAKIPAPLYLSPAGEERVPAG